MTKIIKQSYKVTKNIPILLKLFRIFSKFIVKLFFPFSKSLFRNSFLQYFHSFVSINVNNIPMKFKDGNERLYLFINTQFIMEKDLVNWIDTFKEDDIFFDIGSNIGMFSIYAAKKNIKTICFEGHHSNLDNFTYNIYLNNVSDNITILPILLGKKNESHKFFLRDLTPSTARSEIDHEKSEFRSGLKESLQMNTVTFNLDYLIENKMIPNATKVKLDVDGVEFLILKGYEKFIDNVEEIMIEMYERSSDQWKCFNEFNNKKSIFTKNININYFENNFPKNPYFDEISNFLKNKNFEKKEEFGNNIIFKKKK